jgi:hypothetical protein
VWKATGEDNTIMPVDVKKWLADKAAELGLDESEKVAAEKLLSSDRFRGDFVALPDFHSALDKQKRTYQHQLDEVTQMNSQWQEEYENTYGPALTALQQLQQSGYNTSGFRNTSEGGVVNASTGQVLTPAQIQQMIAEAVEPIRAGAIDFATFVADKSVDYRDTFGKRFEANKFRAFAYENRDKYGNFEQAYDAFTADDRVSKEESDRKKWQEEERERIRMELLSNQGLPEAVPGSEGSPLFTANAQTEEVSRDEARRRFATQFAKADLSTLSP